MGGGREVVDFLRCTMTISQVDRDCLHHWRNSLARADIGIPSQQGLNRRMNDTNTSKRAKKASYAHALRVSGYLRQSRINERVAIYVSRNDVLQNDIERDRSYQVVQEARKETIDLTAARASDR